MDQERRPSGLGCSLQPFWMRAELTRMKTIRRTRLRVDLLLRVTDSLRHRSQ